MKSLARCSNRAPILIGIGLLLIPVNAFAASGAYVVDDAEIGKPGDCKVESWTSFASDGQFTAVTSPACVANIVIPVELGGQLQRSRAAGDWSTSGTLKAKTNLIPVANHPFGLGIAGGSSWDLVTGANTSSYINVPITFQLHDNFRINVNGGWFYDNIEKINYATWGVGFEWNFIKPLTLIGEIFGQAGRIPSVEEGDAPTTKTIVTPRSQIGLRFTPQDNIDLDLIYGHNITGENAHWLTLGLNLRF